MRDRMYEFPSWLWTIYSRLWIRIVMLTLTTTALGIKRASNKKKIKQWMIMMIMITIMLIILIINTFCYKKKNCGHEVVMIEKQFGCCGWGHIHTKADRSCASTKIIPDRISVHILNGDFDEISVTGAKLRACNPLRLSGAPLSISPPQNLAHRLQHMLVSRGSFGFVFVWVLSLSFTHAMYGLFFC